MAALACGYAHTLITGRAGQVLSCGRGLAGQLGHGDTNAAFDFKEISSPVLARKRVKSVAAGLAHSCALTEFGSVFCWGAGTYGQVGDGRTSMSTTPMEVGGSLAGRRAKAIAAGGAHTLCVSREGTVFAWGRGSVGQLGSGAQDDSPWPTEIGGLLRGRRIKQVAAGGEHSLALTEDGRVLAFGSSSHGQLGIGSQDSFRLLPVEVVGVLAAPAGELVKSVAAGQLHSLALTDGGKIYAWGSGRSGQLGQGDFRQVCTVPMEVTGELGGLRVKIVSAGGDHSAAVIEKVAAAGNNLFTWG
jgi:alpha-tubulin suppressor-like RCC1 family protein